MNFMERTYLDDADLISVLPDLKVEEEVKFLSGQVVNDQTNKYKSGKYLITQELELCGKDVFLTRGGEIFKTSNFPSETEISCAEFLLMKINNFELKQILAIRQCTDKVKLISTFDSQDED